MPGFEGLEVWLKDQQRTARREAAGWVVGDIRGARLLIDGEQVVGSRLPAVAGLSGGSVVDAEARAAVAAIIDRLVTHGLIDA